MGYVNANSWQQFVDFGPSRWLDYELEVGALVGGGSQGNQSKFSVADAEERLFGLVLLNDWSARDIQRFEMAPLGPFLGKSFSTVISPWIIPMAALEPFRVKGDGPQTNRGDPEPFPHLVYKPGSQAEMTRNVDMQ